MGSYLIGMAGLLLQGCAGTEGSIRDRICGNWENGNMFMNTGFRIDVAYNEAADVLTFSPNGDYVRKSDGQERNGGTGL